MAKQPTTQRRAALKEAPARKARDRSDVDEATDVVLSRKAFINGVLHYPGEKVRALPGSGFRVTASTPVGNMSVDELEAALAAKRAELRRDARAETTDRTAETEARANATGGTNAAPVVDGSAFDHDQSGAAGGSMKKAEIAAELTEAKVEYDPTSTRDELMELLTKHRAENPAQ